MPLQLTGRHMTLKQEHKDYIEKKVNRLRRLCPKIDEMSFTLTHEKLKILADGTFRAGVISVQATVAANEALEAIDILVDKLEAQVSKAIKKRNDKTPAARQKARAHEAETIAAEALGDEDEEESGEEDIEGKVMEA